MKTLQEKIDAIPQTYGYTCPHNHIPLLEVNKTIQELREEIELQRLECVSYIQYYYSESATMTATKKGRILAYELVLALIGEKK